MYTVARRPSVIVQKTRRGLNKSLETQESTRQEQRLPEISETPKITFQPLRMKHILRSPSIEDTSIITPEYLEIVHFVNHGWSSVKHELEQDNSRVKYYQEKSNPQLTDFSPFDLDAWWGKQLYHNLTNGI